MVTKNGVWCLQEVKHLTEACLTCHDNKHAQLVSKIAGAKFSTFTIAGLAQSTYQRYLQRLQVSRLLLRHCPGIGATSKSTSHSWWSCFLDLKLKIPLSFINTKLSMISTYTSKCRTRRPASHPWGSSVSIHY